MKDALGGGMLLYIVVFFVGIIIVFFAGILAYTKAYKAKNRIIEVIESNINCDVDSNAIGIKEDYVPAVNDSLTDMGYQLGECPIVGERTAGIPYKVCISRQNADNGIYYKVRTYVHFYIPVGGNTINIPVSGETKTLCKIYDY